jgi:hypothetical protein
VPDTLTKIILDILKRLDFILTGLRHCHSSGYSCDRFTILVKSLKLPPQAAALVSVSVTSLLKLRSHLEEFNLQRGSSVVYLILAELGWDNPLGIVPVGERGFGGEVVLENLELFKKVLNNCELLLEVLAIMPRAYTRCHSHLIANFRTVNFEGHFAQVNSDLA